MPRFLVECPHEADETACVKAVEAFLRTGSHFLTRADWGCKDGDHKAWMIVEVETKDEARGILPPHFRRDAKVVKLNYFTMTEIDELLKFHQG
jgi:hypothetical protein